MKKSLDQRIAAKEAKLARDTALVAAMKVRKKVADRRMENRRKILIGAVVLGEMERTPQFAKFVRTILDKTLTRPHDRAALAHLIQGADETVTPASNANTPPTPASPPADAAAGSTAHPPYADKARDRALS